MCFRRNPIPTQDYRFEENMAEGGIRDCGGIPDPDSLVISGVIDGVKQSFIDNGVSLDVLEKLEQLWVSKLTANPNAGMSLKDLTLPPAPSPAKKRGRKKKSEEVPESKNEDIEEELEDCSVKAEIPSDIITLSSGDETTEEKPKVHICNNKSRI